MGDDSSMTIVVGVDGSAGAKAALRWALDEARLRRTVLRVVHAWTFPYAGTGYGILPLVDETLEKKLDENARALLDQVLTEAGAAATGVEVERVTEEGAPAHVLLEHADGADLLVVGSRGFGGFKGLLLGSVSQQCVHHARCAVVVVPTPHES